MTVRDFISAILEEKNENLLDKELAYFIKDNTDGTFDAITIQSIGISDQYILLANKCPNCEEKNP